MFSLAAAITFTFMARADKPLRWNVAQLVILATVALDCITIALFTR